MYSWVEDIDKCHKGKEDLARVGMGEEDATFASSGSWYTEMVTGCLALGSQRWEALQVLRKNLTRSKLRTWTFVSERHVCKDGNGASTFCLLWLFCFEKGSLIA